MKRRVITRLIVVASPRRVQWGTTVLLPGTMPTAETDRSDPGFGERGHSAGVLQLTWGSRPALPMAATGA